MKRARVSPSAAGASKEKKARTKFHVWREGRHNLGAGAQLIYEKRAIAVTDEEFEEMWRLSRHVPRTRNPLNKRQFIHRLQGLITVENGAKEYYFGRQQSKGVSTVSEGPRLAKKCYAHAQRLLSKEPGQREIGGLHCNWYPNQRAWLNYHADDGEDLIFSYSFIRADPKHPDKTTREFRVARKTESRKDYGKEPVGKILMGDGDLIVMKGGEFQKEYVHSVAKLTVYNQRRINVTCRPWKKGVSVIVE